MLNVMIADDDYNVRAGLLELIPWEQLGAKVVLAAENGEQIVQTLGQNETDLIITDIRMPIMNGIELARYVKEHFEHIQIILLSAYAEFEYAYEAINLGVRQYILKPISYEKIKALQELIREIAKEKEYELTLSNRIHDSSLKDNLKKILENGDFSCLDSLIDMKQIGSNVSHTMLSGYYHLFLEVLDEYAKANNLLLYNQDVFSGFSACNTKDEFCSFVRERYLLVQEIRSGKITKSEQLIRAVKHYISEHYTEDGLNVQMVADVFDLSADYLSRLFKAEEDVPLLEYIMNVRMSKAKELISQTQLSINRIAEQVGYMNAKHFMRQFKKRYGMTAIQYRSVSEQSKLEESL